MKKVIDGEHIEMTAEEVSQYEADFKKMKDKSDARATARQEREDLKVSAKQKLVAGEPLTEEEADTIVL